MFSLSISIYAGHVPMPLPRLEKPIMSSITNQKPPPAIKSPLPPLHQEKRKRIFSLSRRSSTRKSLSSMPGEIVDIPEPPRVPVLGHVTEIDQEYPLGSFLHLANKYGM